MTVTPVHFYRTYPGTKLQAVFPSFGLWGKYYRGEILLVLALKNNRNYGNHEYITLN